MQTNGGALPAINSTADIQTSLNSIGSVTPTTTQPPNPAQSKIQNFNQQSTTQKKQPGDNLNASTKKKIESDANSNKTPDENYPITDAAKEGISGISDQLEKVQFNKGLGVAFALLFFLIWMLIPTASGYTRFQLLWFTILGETQITQAGDKTGIGTSDQQQSTTVTLGDTITPETGINTDNQPTVQTGGPDLNGIDFSALDFYGA